MRDVSDGAISLSILARSDEDEDEADGPIDASICLDAVSDVAADLPHPKERISASDLSHPTERISAALGAHPTDRLSTVDANDISHPTDCMSTADMLQATEASSGLRSHPTDRVSTGLARSVTDSMGRVCTETGRPCGREGRSSRDAWHCALRVVVGQDASTPLLVVGVASVCTFMVAIAADACEVASE